MMREYPSWMGTCFNYMANHWGTNHWGIWGGFWGMPFAPVLFWGLGSFIITILVIWTLYWKGRALWKAARLGEKWWFIGLLVINTLGILEILYIYFFSKKKEEKEKIEPIEKK